jgi:hypothetical protein
MTTSAATEASATSPVPITPPSQPAGEVDVTSVWLAVTEAVRQQFPLISALPVEKQHQLLAERLDALHASGLLSAEEAQRLHAKANGDPATGAPSTTSPVDLAALTSAPISLVDVLDAAIPAGVASGEAALDIGDVIVSICTTVGAAIGGAIGGAGGAAAGAAIGGAVGRVIARRRLPQ